MANNQSLVRLLTHACKCLDVNCTLPSCKKMKRVFAHTKLCKRKTNGSCPICKQLITHCRYHANNCPESKCPVPFCLNMKHKLKQQELQQRYGVNFKATINEISSIFWLIRFDYLGCNRLSYCKTVWLWVRNRFHRQQHHWALSVHLNRALSLRQTL